MASRSFWSRSSRQGPLRPPRPGATPQAARSNATPRVRWPVWSMVAGAVVALLCFPPAGWLAGVVNQASGGRLLLLEAKGTVWDGSAVLVLTGGTDSRDARALPGRLSWQLKARTSGLHARLQHACCLADTLEIGVHPGLRRWQVDLMPGAGSTERAMGQWPASLLTGLGTPWNTMEPGGALRLSTQGLSMQWTEGRFAMSGQAIVELVDLSSRLSTLPRLGSYRVVIAGTGQAGESSRVSLSTREGALQLSGDGTWSADGLRLRGEATAAPGDEVALSNLLNIIGRRSGDRSLISIG